MKIRVTMGLGLLLAGSLGAGMAGAECLYPKAPTNIPNGATATEAEMVSAMKEVKDYNNNVTAYLSCLDMEMQARIDAAGADAPADQIAQIKAITAKRHNAAIEELEANANHFNDQVKAFKNKGKTPDDKDKKKKS
jgi:hypothetical protein